MIRLKSVFLFKKLYNLEWDKVEPNSNLKIDLKKINEYNLNSCIINNINDINSRYLLISINQSITSLIYPYIKINNPLKLIQLYHGSPFADDNNKEYRFKIINQIQDDAKHDKLIIIENLDQIYPLLYDLFNRNFQVHNGKKYARICLDAFGGQLININKHFRIIILANEILMNE